MTGVSNTFRNMRMIMVLRLTVGKLVVVTVTVLVTVWTVAVISVCVHCRD